MYTKESTKKSLMEVNAVLNGSLYGDIENSHDYDYKEYERVKMNLERML